jgi:hypothetical protein
LANKNQESPLLCEIATFANEIVGDFARGFVGGRSLASGSNFSTALRDGLMGGATLAGGAQFTNLIGHSWGFIASRFSKPSFAKGVFYYDLSLGFVTLGNAVTGPANLLDKLIPGTSYTYRTHEVAHVVPNRALAGAYVPMNALSLGLSYVISLGQGSEPFHRYRE